MRVDLKMLSNDHKSNARLNYRGQCIAYIGSDIKAFSKCWSIKLPITKQTQQIIILQPANT